MPEAHSKIQKNDKTNSCYLPKNQFNIQTNLLNGISKSKFKKKNFRLIFFL